MVQRWAQRLAWTMFGITLALMVPIVILLIDNRNEPDIWALVEPQGTAGIIAASGVGLILALRRPGNAIGWLLLATGLLGQIGDTSTLWGVDGLADDAASYDAAYAFWAGQVISALAGATAAVFPLLLFPLGRFPDRRSRIVAGLSALAVAMLVFGLMGIDGADLPSSFPDIVATTPNPLPDIVPFSEPSIGIIGLGICGLLSIALLLGRFRAARGIERQQYKWVVLAMAGVVATLVIDFLAVAFGTPFAVVTTPVSTFAVTLVPVSMAVAILRYRLYNIDRVISRALGYTLLSVSLAAAYLLLVLGGGSLVHSVVDSSSSLMTAVATLTVAALFRPLRSSIQTAVDRRFNRAQYDAARTIEAFTSRLRDDINLGAISLELQNVVHDTMQPAHVSLWLRTDTNP